MPTPAIAAVLSIALAAIPAAAAARPGDDAAATSVEPSRVEAGTFYRGATLTVRGSAGASSQIVVLALEPSAAQTYNRRGRIAKIIWGGLEHVTFEGAPGVYYLYTSATIASIASPAVRARLGLGYDTLRSRVRVSGTAADAHTMVEQLVRLKEREALYRVESGAVHLEDVGDGRRPFRVAIVLPAGTPPGVVEIRVLEFAGGELARAERIEVPVVRVGLPAGLHRLAHEQSLAYGTLAVVVMLVTGLATGLAGSGRRRRVATRPGEPPARAATRMAGLAREVGDMLRPHGLARHPPADTAALEDRYHVFRDLLSVNNELLGLLSELEEEASWTSFRQPRVRMEIRALFDGTADMVALLNRISGDRYFDLANVTSSIRHDVLEFLSELQEQEDPRLTLRLSEINSATAGRVGGKAVNLARLDCDLDVRVPPFFVITTEAYRTLLDDGGVGSKLRTVLAPARLDAPEDFRRRCELAQSFIDQAPIPPAVLAAIDRAWTASDFAADDRAAVRSSAAGEDSELSFAGQFESMLNVHRTALGTAWKQVIRSRFAPRAVFYRRAAGLAEVDTPMAVLVQRMVRASAAGVLFTRQPEDPRAPLMWVTSVYGLGSDASIGTASADRLAVSRRPPHHVAERRLARKSERLVSAGVDGVTRMVVDPDDQLRASVSDENRGRAGRAGAGGGEVLRATAGHRVGERCRGRHLDPAGAPAARRSGGDAGP